MCKINFRMIITSFFSCLVTLCLMLSSVVEAASFKVTTNSLNLNLRASIGNGRILAKMPTGSVIEGEDLGNGWAKVTYNGITGYATMQYLTKISTASTTNLNLYNLAAAYPADGVYTLTPGCATNMNLSIYNDGTANKAQAVIYNAGYRNSSKWKIQRIGNSEWYYIIDVNSGKSLDNEAGRGANGNMISLWPEQGVCQRWRFWQVRNGVYVIQAYTNDQFVLDVAGADTRANTIVQLWPYNASPAQQWMLTKTQQSVTRPATNNTSNTVSTTTYYVNTNSLNLNLRQSPSSSASIVAKMPSGATVTGYDAGNGWGKVTYNGITGYASMQYLSRVTDPTPIINDDQKQIYNKMVNLSRSSGYMVGTKYSGAGQCRGFANKVYQSIFSGVSYISGYSSNNYAATSYNGSYVVGSLYNFSASDTSAVKNLFMGAKAGAFVQMGRRYTLNSSKTAPSPHSAIIYSIQSDGVEFYEANTDGKNTIKINKYTWATLADKNKGFTIYLPNNYR